MSILGPLQSIAQLSVNGCVAADAAAVSSAVTSADQFCMTPPSGGSDSYSSGRRTPLAKKYEVELIKLDKGFLAGIKNWSSSRSARRILPTVMVALDPHAKAVTAAGEVGNDTRAIALNRSALRSFDSAVLARFHGIEGRRVEDCSSFVRGGPSGQGHDSFHIIDKRRFHEGSVFLRRNLSPSLLLHVVAVAHSDHYPVARGFHHQQAPNRIVCSRITDELRLRISRPDDVPVSPEERGMVQDRLGLAERIALLASPVGIGLKGYDGETAPGIAHRLLEDFEAGRKAPDVNSYSAPTMRGDRYKPEVNFGIGVFLAALIDVFDMSDEEFNWLAQNLR